MCTRLRVLNGVSSEADPGIRFSCKEYYLGLDSRKYPERTSDTGKETKSIKSVSSTQLLL